MQLIAAGEATATKRRTVVYLTDDDTDLIPQTSKVPSAGELQVSINGAALADGTLGNWGEVAGTGNGQGLYTYTFTTTEIATVGYVVLHVDISGCRTFVKDVQVVNNTAVN